MTHFVLSISDHDPGDHKVSKTEFVTRMANNSAFMEPVARGLFIDLDMDKNGQLEARDTQLYFDKIDQNGTFCITALCSTRTVRPALQRSVLPKRYVLPYSALFYQNGMSCSTRTVRPALQRSVLPERYVIPYNAPFYLDTLKFPLLL